MSIHRTTGLMPFHIAAGLLLGGFCLCPANGQASFQGLGTLPDGIVRSIATGVSADGSVVVGTGYIFVENIIYLRVGFRWTSADGMVSLTELPPISITSSASGVSADGSVVVGSTTSRSIIEAYRWTTESGLVGLGSLPFGGFKSGAAGVSADGSVVVGSSPSAASSSGGEAYRWTSGGGMVALGDLAGGGFKSRASAVTADGTVVVGRGLNDSGFEAFRWISGAGMVGLGDLPGGIFSSDAKGVSADGLVVVGRSISALSDLNNEAFRWTSGGGMVGLGDLAGGDFHSVASDVCADGSIVVGYGIVALGAEAFIWDETSGMQSLQSVLEGQLGLDLTGWTLRNALDITDDGTTIVGYGTNPDGDNEAYIAIIPGPNVCPGDVVGFDGNVNVTDLLSLLAGWGPNPGHPADINDDGQVNVTDLLTILGAWGACP